MKFMMLGLKITLKPVRACVGSALAEGYLVEIQAFGKLREN